MVWAIEVRVAKRQEQIKAPEKELDDATAEKLAELRAERAAEIQRHDEYLRMLKCRG
jgi:hypothetical protein